MKRAILLVGVLVITGCKRTTTEYGPTLREPATVVDNLYVPSRHESHSDMSVGIGFDGELEMRPTTVTVQIPEKRGVVFRCQHGKFIVLGARGSNGDRMFAKFDPGDRCNVIYREVFRVVRDGDKELSRLLVDYDFLDAEHVDVESNASLKDAGR